MPIEQFDEWIDNIVSEYEEQAQSCSKFSNVFSGYYSPEYLAGCKFVVTDTIPKPDIPELRQIGLGDFLDMDCGAITYKHMYFMKPQHQENLEIHIHELMHTVQWNQLGGVGFLERYIQEINEYGYDDAPLENMAYALGRSFKSGAAATDVVKLVRQKI
ncbi:hypothetical protein F6X00_11570 [Vibrio vulnificus]|uniref:hypothetical protein n=1 Tax=Vibrio TaxID=662 RepID=UPI0015FB436C|nr:hypothetical protein [Vibrio vulnificus]HCG5296728.1 hypothetical protein [Vibrio parahaemolyticus]MCA0768082.1 hypothetical protein [Vibrio vulnificus]MDT9658998.1 hypothetical protein [Vibrio vulnificus]QMV36977.1 hypothetical protein F6X00_11570 [Vibrio vulnificus]HAT8544758.1 hypothetical protein [Vibrio vulnificus]